DTLAHLRVLRAELQPSDVANVEDVLSLGVAPVAGSERRHVADMHGAARGLGYRFDDGERGRVAALSYVQTEDGMTFHVSTFPNAPSMSSDANAAVAASRKRQRYSRSNHHAPSARSCSRRNGGDR